MMRGMLSLAYASYSATFTGAGPVRWEQEGSGQVKKTTDATLRDRPTPSSTKSHLHVLPEPDGVLYCSSTGPTGRLMVGASDVRGTSLNFPIFVG